MPRLPLRRVKAGQRAMSERGINWLAEELRNTADAIGPVPDLAERSLRYMADELEAGTWKPFHERMAAALGEASER